MNRIFKITVMALCLTLLCAALISCGKAQQNDPVTDPAATPATDPITDPITEPTTEPTTEEVIKTQTVRELESGETETTYYENGIKVLVTIEDGTFRSEYHYKLKNGESVLVEEKMFMLPNEFFPQGYIMLKETREYNDTPILVAMYAETYYSSGKVLGKTHVTYYENGKRKTEDSEYFDGGDVVRRTCEYDEGGNIQKNVTFYSDGRVEETND
jgi:antitoxin component YwqK of YwqJK toxin-antitoxin module